MPAAVRKGQWHVGAALVLVLFAGMLALAGEWRGRSPESGDDTAMALLRGDSAGFARVTGARPFRFPEDHVAHPDYRSEWWYFTGNLETANGRLFGFQLTFFRSALAPDMPERASRLASRQAWMGHFAITDVTAGSHRFAERFQRGAAGLAGSTLGPVRVWLDDWVLRAERPDGLFPLRLRAREGDMALDLRLSNERPRVLQGDRGYSRKGAEPGNASHYYSYTRLSAEGTVTDDGGRTHEVAGTAWLDREWSTSALGPEQAGWDWFALQLDDGRDVMVYRLRRHDGGTDRWSAGMVAGAQGKRRQLDADDFRVTPLRWWRSPDTGVRYPVAWRLVVPASDLALRAEAVLPAQEMRTAFRYWEGAVTVTDRAGRPAGRGYLEMTGYSPSSPPHAPR
ncbi:lipocalin-like domain-containing protein [Arhodomonas sp. SL1]|uniref:lipocalin-like domain-containing protein n=1 Tax=Arhodomonas sp. SL1 TaxID=3425691 RepID=UPI003F880C87